MASRKMPISAAERRYFEKIRNMPCICCGEGDTSYAHHVRDQGARIGHYCIIPLCLACHVGPHGIHGDKQLLKAQKTTELKLLHETLAKVNA
jgi:hypothetical protein